ncbi:transcription factor GTE6-like [Macadamia integrifolia]|uniref:transcription factor GTE6-like n=1 Tax=Macadamia integrifolia TaxID=60698 RepID=UPI001C4EF5FD|nr:transcription factor GTE6-like [Macadamia integrifolia]
MDGPLMDIRKAEYDAPAVEMLRQYVDKTLAKVDELEQKVNEVEQFYSSSNKKQPNSSKCGSVVKDREKPIPSIKRQQQDAARREAASAKRMQELMRQFSTILRQITQHKWAGPFLEPVDVEGLGLHDYYEVISFSRIFFTLFSVLSALTSGSQGNMRSYIGGKATLSLLMANYASTWTPHVHVNNLAWDHQQTLAELCLTKSSL